MKKNQTLFLQLCLSDAFIALMKTQSYDTITIQSICDKAGVGRTTFYRYFNSKNGKENLIIFKIIHLHTMYKETHKEEIKQDGGLAFLHFIYENRFLFRILYQQKQILTIMKVFEDITNEEWPQDKSISYLKSFFIYAYFGVIYQWMKYDFDETPSQIQQHIANTLIMAIQNQTQNKK